MRRHNDSDANPGNSTTIPKSDVGSIEQNDTQYNGVWVEVDQHKTGVIWDDDRVYGISREDSEGQEWKVEMTLERDNITATGYIDEETAEYLRDYLNVDDTAEELGHYLGYNSVVNNWMRGKKGYTRVNGDINISNRQARMECWENELEVKFEVCIKDLAVGYRPVEDMQY